MKTPNVSIIGVHPSHYRRVCGWPCSVILDDYGRYGVTRAGLAIMDSSGLDFTVVAVADARVPGGEVNAL